MWQYSFLKPRSGRTLMAPKTVPLTMAQALVRHLCNQFIEVDGAQAPLFAGVFAIFGHGNVTCLGEALYSVRDTLPTWRGQNEQSMALAALGFAKAKRRRQIMAVATSIGPGATNVVTAAGVGHANRLPVLILSGDRFASRRPDPVLQQVEHFGNPTTTVNDAFRAVTRYWDRIENPEQIISSLPQAVATMLDPADCGPAFLGLCQDVQEMTFDYPAAFFEPTVHTIPRPRPDAMRLKQAVDLLKTAERPLIISGGGVRYSGAQDAVARLAAARGIPVAETIAGKGTLTHEHPVHVGPIGIVGSTSANAMAAEADVIVAIGTRLQDFTTGSWTAFSRDARFISINTARFDATKHRALAVVGDALATVSELDAALGEWAVPKGWSEKGRTEFAEWNRLLDKLQAPTNTATPTYAQVVAAVNRKASDADYMVASAGGLPGEVS
jgi:3D-(3,5/4)-trihydroxycyclohexane-1,2-dione acylhydrolase (decyclizing)